MLSSSWIELIRLIPPQRYDNLTVTTSSGMEINIQTVLRAEEEYMVVRGRLSGTTDAGRIFFVPYDQINFLNFITPLKEAEVHAMFTAPPPAAAAPPVPPVGDETVPETEDEPAPAVKPSEAVPAAAPPVRTTVAGRSAILERLRARVAPKQPDK